MYKEILCWIFHGRFWAYSPIEPYHWQVYCPKCERRWTQTEGPF